MSDKKVSEPNTSAGVSRRKLIKAGAMAAPVLMAAQSKPVFASFARNNCTVSGQLSGNISQPAGSDPCENPDFKGRTPGYWGQRPDEWSGLFYGMGQEFNPGSCTAAILDQNGNVVDDGRTGNGKVSHCQGDLYNDDGTKFSDVFPMDTLYSSLTLMQVIHLTGTGDSYQLGAHAAAAALNAAAFGKAGYGYDLGEVIDLYHQYHILYPVELRNAFEYLNQKGG